MRTEAWQCQGCKSGPGKAVIRPLGRHSWPELDSLILTGLSWGYATSDSREMAGPRRAGLRVTVAPQRNFLMKRGKLLLGFTFTLSCFHSTGSQALLSSRRCVMLGLTAQKPHPWAIKQLRLSRVTETLHLSSALTPTHSTDPEGRGRSGLPAPHRPQSCCSTPQSREGPAGASQALVGPAASPQACKVADRMWGSGWGLL